MSSRFLLFASIFMVLFGIPLSAHALDDPLLGSREVYLKDSILALFLPSDGNGKDMQSRLITFDAREPGHSVSNKDAKIIKNGESFSLSNGAKVTGTPGAIGTLRDDEERLSFAVADYGGGGLHLRVGRIDRSGNVVQTPKDHYYESKPGGFDEIKATDVVMHDINGDGTEDFIVGEVFYYGNNEQRTSVLIVDGSDLSRHNRIVIEEKIGAKTPFVRLDVGDFTGDGIKELAVAYSSIPKGKDGGAYYLRVYQFDPVKMNLNGGYYESHVSDYKRGQDVLDLAVGDFSGSGRDEIIVVSDYRTSSNSKCHFKYFYYATGGWQSKYKMEDPSTARTSYDGAIAAAFDLNHDGRDEFIWIMPDSSNLYMLGVVTVDGNRNMDTHYIFNDQSTDFEDESLYKVMYMTAGSFSGRSRAGQAGKAAGEVVVVRRSWDGKREATLSVFDVELDAGGAFKALVDRGDNYRRLGIQHHAPLLLPGNILGESLRVGSGEVVSEDKNVMVTSVIQMPPKHTDYIPIPWAADGSFIPPAGQENGILAGTMYEDFYTTITTTESSSSEASVSEATDWGLTGGAHLNINTRLQLDFAADAGGDFMTGQTIGQGKSREFSHTGESKFYDTISYAIVSRQLWSYPIIGERIKSGDESLPVYYEFTAPFGEIGYFTASDTAFPDTYNPMHERYNVLSYPSDIALTLDYDEAKAVSAKMGNDTQIKTEKSLTWSGSFEKEDERSNKINFETSLTAGVALGDGDSEKSGLKKIFGKGVNRDDAKMIAEGSFGGHYFYETGSILSNKWNKSVNLTFRLGDVEQQAQNANRIKYTMRQQAHILPGGALQMANSAELPVNDKETLWGNSNSAYVRSPDLALNLPGKFKIDPADIENAFVKVTPEGEPLTALKIRGLRILNKSGSEYPFGLKGLIPRDLDGTRLSFPVYNYSTGKSVEGGFGVRISIVPVTPETDAYLALPGGKRTPEAVYVDEFRVEDSIPYNQPGSKNWIFVDRPLDAAKIRNITKFDDYRLFIEIDTDDEYAEIHEKWDYMVEHLTDTTFYVLNPTGGDPGGNNLGYSNIFFCDILEEVEDVASASNSAFGGAVRVGEREESAERVRVNMEVREMPGLGREAIMSAIEEKRDIPVEFEFWYDEGPESIPGFVVMVMVRPHDGDTGRLIASRVLPGLVKGRRYTVDSTLGRMILLFMAERAGKIEIEAIGSIHDVDFTSVRHTFAYGSDASGSSGGCGAGVGSVAAVALAVLAMQRRGRRR